MANCEQRFLQQINRGRGVTIKQNLLCVMSLLCLLAVMTGPTYAANWAGLSGAETLRELVSGARAEIQLKPGVIAIGEYYADGTAKIEAWGDTFARTWEVRGDDQVCYSSFRYTDCYTFEQNLDVQARRHFEQLSQSVLREQALDKKDHVGAKQGGLVELTGTDDKILAQHRQ